MQIPEGMYRRKVTHEIGSCNTVSIIISQNLLEWHLFKFPLETRFQGQNDKNLNNFSVTKDVLLIPGR